MQECYRSLGPECYATVRSLDHLQVSHAGVGHEGHLGRQTVRDTLGSRPTLG